MSYSGTYQGTFGGGYQGAEVASPLLPSIFDTGLGKPQRTIIRDAIVALLQRLLRANGGYLASLVPISTIVTGGHDEAGVDLIFEALNGQAPAIAVSVGDKTYTPKGETFSVAGDLEVHVYVLTNSLRSKLARVQQDVVSLASSTADPGTEVILEHVEQLLIGQQLDARGSIKQLRPAREQQIGTDGASIELWHQQYSIQVSRRIDPNRDLSVDLTAIRTYHRLADQADSPVIVTTDTEV